MQALTTWPSGTETWIAPKLGCCNISTHIIRRRRKHMFGGLAFPVCFSRMNDAVFAVVDWLKQRNEETNGMVAPNLFIYNSLLGAVKQCKQFGEIQTKGMIASPVTYSTALQAYKRVQDGFGALDFFVEFREKYRNGYICNVSEYDWEIEFLKLENFTKRVCYQVMRHWLVVDDNLSINVLKLLVKMDNAGIPLGRAEHERLLWACTRGDHYTIASVFSGHGKFHLVETILQDMVSAGIEPTVVTFNAIISGCTRNDSSSADAYDWFIRMKANNILPNNVTYEMMIEALAKEGKPRLAYELYLKAQNLEIDLSSKAYDILVQSSKDFKDSFDPTLLGPRPKENLQSRNAST